jgi:Uma2 family endonuclease
VRGPDIAFVAQQRLRGPESATTGWLEGAPTLAVEVISPSQTRREVAEKNAQWLEAGAERVLEVRPRTRTVTIHRRYHPPKTLGDGDSLTSEDAALAVAGFEFPVSETFGHA